MPVEVAADPELPLVRVLRDELELRGVRPGCGIGECGACTVLADGAPIRSCITPLSAVAGAAVVTPEGLGTPAAPHRIQQAFLDEQAAQCGYCVNGMIMTVAALLEHDPTPEEATVRAALADHICRCGTQHRILRAVARLAGRAVPSPGPVLRQEDPVPSEPEPEPPGVLRGAPNVEQWLRPLPDGRIEAFSGRVELGQGVRTALAQLVAAELELAPEDVVVRSAATDATPDEGYTAGSGSMEQGGAALGRAAAAFRRLRDDGKPPIGPIEPEDVPRRSGPAIGAAVPRADLLPKLTGSAAYIHDLTFPDLLHARALLPPTYDARPAQLEVDAVAAMPGVVRIVRDGAVVVVVAEGEEQAVKAVDRLARTATWDDPGLELEPGGAVVPLSVIDEPGVDAALAAGVRQLSATYAKPHEAHASMAPSCAVALAAEDQLTVWTHGQGVYPLRRELSALFGLDESRLTVRHVDGPGCYGHNGADDAAGFAAVAARAVPGRPVRFTFSVGDELGWEPYGPAMTADLSAALDADGRIAAWRSHVRTGAHTSRPSGSGDRLAVAWLAADGPARPFAGGGEGGVRNAVPVYDLPVREISAEYARTPLRTSALRTLGAYLNVFSIESFMDELAEAAGMDPVAFRLAHLRDERARTVLEAAVSAAGWSEHVGPSGAGRGVAVARYKNVKAYVAQVVEAEVDPVDGRVAVRRVVTACDAGVVINPDGLRNQLEGGILQGLSRALFEEVRYDSGGVASRSWTSYPVLRFVDVPKLETILIDRPGHPPLGAGEASTPVTPAALANAVDDAIGIRVRRLPMTPERLRARLEEMDEVEQGRVLV